MNFALVGSDAESLALASAALAAGHSIAWACDIEKIESMEDPAGLVEIGLAYPELAEVAQDPTQQDPWSALADMPAVDAVIIGR